MDTTSVKKLHDVPNYIPTTKQSVRSTRIIGSNHIPAALVERSTGEDDPGDPCGSLCDATVEAMAARGYATHVLMPAFRGILASALRWGQKETAVNDGRGSFP